ncbi:NAD-dependent epimerase/dehydratase family protein [Sphingopyxis sp.]|uniref:NAD-dependent epimerase/dehydratase family protein n=1 Tax=Sphingopyxis sp. TaxID=1908224 RepID=UPI003D0C80AD
MAIAVTGASGGIGSRLVNMLRSQGHNVLALSRHRPLNLDAAVAWKSYSLSDPVEATAGKLHDVDHVVHLAAALPGSAADELETSHFWDNNVIGTQHLIEAMTRAKVGRLILASSANIYRTDQGEVAEDSPIGPQSRVHYLASKATQEWLAASMCKDRDISRAVMRISSVIGDGRSIVDRLANDLAAQNPVRIDDGAAFGADFIERDDVCRGIMLAIELELHGDYNLSSGTRTELIDAVLELAKIFDSGPGAIKMMHADRAPDTGFPAINCDKLRNLGFEPQPIADVLRCIAERAKMKVVAA